MAVAVALLAVLCLCTCSPVAVATVATQSCERAEEISGCSVTHGHAYCEAFTLNASLAALPRCTRKITFSLLADPHAGSQRYWTPCLYADADLSHLPNVEDLTFRTNRANFTHVRFSADDWGCYLGILNSEMKLRSLRLHMLLSIVHVRPGFAGNYGMYRRFKYLETLEIVRGQRYGLPAVMHLIGNETSLRSLTLRNVQQFYSEGYYSTLDLAYFLCGSNLEYLDLSYNDIIALRVNTSCSNVRLRYLNLAHNLLAQTIPVVNFLWRLLPLLGNLREMRASKAGTDYQAGLWDDEGDDGGGGDGDDGASYRPALDRSGDGSEDGSEDGSRDGSEDGSRDGSRNQTAAENGDGKEDKDMILPSLFQHSPLAAMASYGQWVQAALEVCQHLAYPALVACALRHPQIDDGFMLCLDPDFYSYGRCRYRDIFSKLGCVLENKCNFSCENYPPIPVPPKLEYLSMRNFQHFEGPVDVSFSKQCKAFHLKLYSQNNIQRLDLASLGLNLEQMPFERLTLSGLHSLKYLNLQNHQVPFLLSSLVMKDAKALEELHIGGGRVAQNDTLPLHPLDTFNKLSLLNLSYSNLSGFESGVFSKHASLSVLDLSHNQLSASSLSSLDLSRTSLRSFNLSHNRLTFIPLPLRRQLELMRGLHIYLEGNAFICSCDNLPFLQWIQSDLPITIHGPGNHECVDSPGNTIHSIDVTALRCNWYWQQPLIIVVSTLSAVLLLIGVVVTYRKRFHCANLLFRLRETLQRQRRCRGGSGGEGESPSVFTYDAFVVYSSVKADRLWVHYNLINTLESVYGFRLCIHHRNFPGGFPIVDNIEKAIRTSRKVLLIMSPNFLQSEWCLQETHMTMTVDRTKLVVVMYESVASGTLPIPAIVRHILDTTTYIEWHESPREAENLFWKRLRKALYSSHMEERPPADPNILLNQIELETDSQAHI